VTSHGRREEKKLESEEKRLITLWKEFGIRL
jgi:hypothetical protein